MRRYQLIPSHAVQTLLITSVSPLPSGEIGAPYSFTFNAIGGVAPYSWSEVGAIPSGLTFSGGTLSGTPTGTFSSSFNVTVTDSVGSQFTRAFSLTVITAVQITTASPLPGGTVGVAYSTTIAATGGATPYSWSILGFTGANSYSINSVTGVLTGTLGVAEIDSINIQVVDALGIPSAKNFNLTVIPAASLTITTSSPLPAATQSSTYSTTMAATGGTPPYTWSLTSHTGTNTWSVSSGGLVSGTPANLETDSLVIKVVDSVSSTASGTFSLTVNPASGIVFDRFISATGDDNNNGLTPATAWSITALNNNQSSYAGKKVGIIGDIGATLSGFQWTGTAGQFSCSAATITVGMYLMITGTPGGSGSLSGYASGNVYYVSATNGSTTGTLTTKGGSQAQALITTVGTPTGLTFLLNQPILYGTKGGTKTTILSLVNGSGNQPALSVQGGTSSGALTYLASCNSSGVYTPRWAVIDASNGSGTFPTNQVAVMGQSSQSAVLVSQPGFTTYDGLGIRGHCFCAIIMDYQAQPKKQNVIITNCELYNGLCTSSSNNPGSIRYRNINGVVITNNKFYDLAMTSGATGGSPVWGYIAIMAYGEATGSVDASVITNNTVYNANGCLQKDENTDFANCSYNYLDHGNFGSAAGTDGGIAQGSVVSQQPSPGVTSNFHHNICLGMFYAKPQSATAFSLGAYNIYNNTFYGTPNYHNFDAIEFATANGDNPPAPPNGKCPITFQNNLIYAANGYDTGAIYVATTAFNIANATFNNNVYGNGSTMFSILAEETGHNLASWQSTTGCDLQSVSISSTPFLSTPQPITPSTFATNSLAVIGGVTCGAMDGSGPIGCNFSNVQ